MSYPLLGATAATTVAHLRHRNSV